MTPFVSASEVIFCLTMILYLVSLIIGVICFSMSISYRLKPIYVLPVALVFATAVFFCYLSDAIRIRYFSFDSNEIRYSPCFLPAWSVILIAVLLVVLSVLWLFLIIRKRLSSLTAMSVKEAISKLPIGLCFYDETGRLLLLNEQVKMDCREYTGLPLNDGCAFWSDLSSEKVKDGVSVLSSDGSLMLEREGDKVIMYRRIVHDMDGKMIYELCGMDISREFSLKKELERQNENLTKMNRRLRKYGQAVEEVTREKEILAAKIKVHGNLGTLILHTKKELAKKDYDRDSLIAEWNNLLLLILAPDDEGEDKFAEADRIASSVGVRVFYKGNRPEKGTTAEKIMASAVSECVTNTARHADGTELYVSMKETEMGYDVEIQNNGKQPEEEIKEKGGLVSLRGMVENIDGKMIVESRPRFLLKISLPKEEKIDER